MVSNARFPSLIIAFYWPPMHLPSLWTPFLSYCFLTLSIADQQSLSHINKHALTQFSAVGNSCPTANISYNTNPRYAFQKRLHPSSHVSCCTVARLDFRAETHIPYRLYCVFHDPRRRRRPTSRSHIKGSMSSRASLLELPS